jgi:uncharacterized protein YwbE
MKITEEDCDKGRKVKLRNGQVATLYSFRRGDMYCVYGFVKNREDLTSWKADGSTYDVGINELDIVSFVEDTFNITKEDCAKGRKVKLRNGKVARLTEFYPVASTYKVQGVFASGYLESWSTNGSASVHVPTHAHDIIGFVDEFVLTKEDCDKGRKVKFRNGKVGVLLKWIGIEGNEVLCEIDSNWYNWDKHGKFSKTTDEFDIVGFIDEDTFESELTNLLNKYSEDALAKYVKSGVCALKEWDKK